MPFNHETSFFYLRMVLNQICSLVKSSSTLWFHPNYLNLIWWTYPLIYTYIFVAYVIYEDNVIASYRIVYIYVVYLIHEFWEYFWLHTFLYIFRSCFFFFFLNSCSFITYLWLFIVRKNERKLLCQLWNEWKD